MDYRIIALDIDGTLTNSSKEISAPTLHALLDIQEKGYRVVLASGRPTPGMKHLAEKLHLDSYGSYILSYNGGEITECRTNRTIFRKTLQRTIVPELFTFATANGIGLLTYTDDCIISGTPIDRFLEEESKINGLPVKYVPNFVEYVNFDINKCLLTGEPDHLASMEIQLKELYGASYNIFRSEPYFLEFMPQNIDKAYGLNILLTDLGLTREQLITCGDGYNDITMIEFAGLGIAMENAQERVKAVANYITGSNDNNGIVHVIDKFIRKKVPSLSASI
ncbi:MAG: Cof-type HAD-IIB family hydrolase [Eubacteriales bacterium]